MKKVITLIGAMLCATAAQAETKLLCLSPEGYMLNSWVSHNNPDFIEDSYTGMPIRLIVEDGEIDIQYGGGDVPVTAIDAGVEVTLLSKGNSHLTFLLDYEKSTHEGYPKTFQEILTFDLNRMLLLITRHDFGEGSMERTGMFKARCHKP